MKQPGFHLHSHTEVKRAKMKPDCNFTSLPLLFTSDLPPSTINSVARDAGYFMYFESGTCSWTIIVPEGHFRRFS